MKTLFKIFSFSLVAAAALMMQSCSDDKDNISKGSFLEVLYNGEAVNAPLEFSLGGGFQMLSVKCDGEWTAVVDDQTVEYTPQNQEQADDLNRWISISNHAGNASYYDEDSVYHSSWVKVSFKYNESEDRSASITFKSGDLSKTVQIKQFGAGAEPGDFFQTAYLLRESIHVGYNLGNTLDANPEKSRWFNPKSDLDYETSWGQPVTTPEIINEIVGKGFDIIRIPVTWHPHMDADGTVSEVWMNRVQEVVDYVLNAGAYCILNVQHDTGARNGRTDGAAWLKADLEAYPESSVKFKYLWQQIAERFKDYGEKLVFEAFNEILDENDEWGDPSSKDAYNAITKLEQDFVNTVRESGGNNEYRNLIVNTYGAGHTNAKLDNFVVPTDKHRGHLLASIHSYDPYNFCCDNEDWNIFTFDSKCESEIDDLFAMINNRFNFLGIPYIYGEFGAIDEENKDMGERVKYTKYMMKKFQDYGTTGLWWMGLFDRHEMEWYEPEIVDALMAPFK